MSAGIAVAEGPSQGQYRYVLHRCVHDFMCPTPSKRLLWVMLNPSTATDDRDDPTIRKVMGYTRRWGYDELRVVNLYARRETDQPFLWYSEGQGEDIVGPANDFAISAEAANAASVVCAWGSLPPQAVKRRDAVIELLLRVQGLNGPRHTKLLMIGACKDGSPKHPSRPAYTDAPLVFRS